MAKDPAVLFYTSDFISGTITMTDEQRGQYILLLCLQHQKGYLTEKDMLKICGTYDIDVFSKFVKDGDKYYNIRMKEESERRKNYIESRRKNRSNEPKKEKKISKTYDKHMENENENEDINIIVDYLNNKTGKNFKSSSRATKNKIKARLNEKYTVNDFKKVIDNKVSEWKGTDMDKYLRPETLFSPKFESYLNQKPEKDSTRITAL